MKKLLESMVKYNRLQHKYVNALIPNNTMSVMENISVVWPDYVFAPTRFTEKRYLINDPLTPTKIRIYTPPTP